MNWPPREDDDVLGATGTFSCVRERERLMRHLVRAHGYDPRDVINAGIFLLELWDRLEDEAAR